MWMQKKSKAIYLCENTTPRLIDAKTQQMFQIGQKNRMDFHLFFQI